MGASMTGGSSSSSKSGYSALPKNIKAQFDPFASEINKYALPSNPGVKEMFTPMGQTLDETAAFDAMRGGFAPTADSLKSDIAMQMNPFNDSVINEINRQGNGQNSLLKEILTNAGTGSGGVNNRDILGANDIDLSRMNTIGQFLQNQFNTSMGNAMTTLPSLRQADAGNMLGIGDFVRKLDLQTKGAPIAALNAGTDLMAPFLQGGKSSGSSQGGLLPALGSFF